MIYWPTFCTVEVWGWRSNFIPHFTGLVFVYWCTRKKTLQYDGHIHGCSLQYWAGCNKLGAIYCIYSETFLILASPLQQFNDMGSSSREMYVPTYEINDNGPGGTLFGRSETLFRRSKPSNVRVHVRARECARARVRLWEVKMILITKFMGLTWGPSGGRQDPGAWAPCGPHDLCFLWKFITLLHTGHSIYQRTSFLHILSMVN